MVGVIPPPRKCQHVCKTMWKLRILRPKRLIPSFQSGWDDPPPKRTKMCAKPLQQLGSWSRGASYLLFKVGWDDLPKECKHSCNTNGKVRILMPRRLGPSFQSGWGDPPPYGVPKCLQRHGESNDSEAEAPHTFFSKWLGRPPPPRSANTFAKP